MNNALALRRSSIDAAFVAALLLLIPLRLLLVGLVEGRVLVLLACYAAVGCLAVVSTAKSQGASLINPVVAAGVGAAAVSAAYLWSSLAPGRSLTIAAVVLGTAAAISEEALFRGLLFQRLERWGPIAAIAISALVFAAVHVPLYGTPALWVDIPAGVLLGWQRWSTNGWGASATTHALANLLAVMR